MRNILSALLGLSVLFLPVAIRADNPATDAAPATNVKPATGSAVTAVVAKPVSSEVAKVAQEEIIRRQATQLQARSLIDEGCQLVHNGKYEAAIAKLEEARKLLPRAKATEIDYDRAAHALSEAYTQLAERALKAYDYARAKDFAKKALECDPGNHTPERIISRAIKGGGPPPPPPAPTPDNTPEFQAKKDEIKKLFREGKILLNSGQYDEAEKRFQQVLLLDPYSEDAHEMLQIVNDARHPSTNNGEEAARRRMLWQADSAWLLPTGGDVKPPNLATSGTPIPTGQNQTLLQKLNEIRFPEIKFRDAALVDVVTFLSEESRKLDPKGEGVNIVLGPGLAVGGAEAAPAPPAAEGAAPAAAPAPAATTATAHPITVMLRNIPMVEALNLVAQLANLKYRLGANAVVLLPLDAPIGEMITKSYPVSASAFAKFIVAPEGGGGGAGGGGGDGKIGQGIATTVTLADVKQVFTGLVDFPAGSTIYFNEKAGMLIMKNTAENIEQFEKVLPNFTGIAPQIEIEAKFIDISQGDLDELGFKWGVGQYTFGSFGVAAGGGSLTSASGLNSLTDGLRNSSSLGGSAIAAALGGAAGGNPINNLFVLNGILTDPQFQVILQALAQKQSTDVLSAPKVTTENSVAAEIKVVQEFIYPSEYTEPQVGGAGGGITPTIPSAFKSRDVGVILQVTPALQPDGYSIELKLSPQVVDFLGFIDYSPGNITQTTTVNGSNLTQTVPYKIVQPLFSTRSVATSVVVYDGQTVVLGGLIKETVTKIDDKVPFLGDLPIVGRLFRSKVTNRSKENLLIFVTARLIGPNGLPIHPDVARGGIR